MQRSFTIILPHHTYAHTYPTDQFTDRFKGSMITAMLDLDPECKEIELTQDAVTPYCLQYLEHLLEDTVPDIYTGNAGRYLLIEELDILSNPKYALFHSEHPTINILTDASTKYTEILSYAIRHEFDRLADYVWSLSSPELPAQENSYLVGLAAYHDNLPAFKRLFQYQLTLWFTPQQAERIIGPHSYIDVKRKNKLNLSEVHLAALGNANRIMRYLRDQDRLICMYAIHPIVHNNNLEGADILQGVMPISLVKTLIEMCTDDMLVHLLLPGPEYSYTLAFERLITQESHDVIPFLHRILSHLQNREVLECIVRHQNQIEVDTFDHILKDITPTLREDLRKVDYTNSSLPPLFNRYTPVDLTRF